MVQKIILLSFPAKHFDVFWNSTDFLHAAAFHVCICGFKEYLNAAVLLM